MQEKNNLTSLNLNNSMQSIVWFNGPSVKQFYNIPPQECEIGCNFILDLRKVHHVCCYDKPTMDIIDKKEKAKEVTYWTRKIFAKEGQWNIIKHIDPHFKQIKDMNLHAKRLKQLLRLPNHCSGTLALIVAYMLGAEKLYLLGCDWTITNASVYDEQYKWRRFQPIKHNAEKIALITKLSDLMELTIVHTNHKRPFGPKVKWITPAEFAEGHNINMAQE